MKTKSKFLSIFLIFLFVYGSFSFWYLHHIKENLLDQKYIETTTEMKLTLETLIEEKREAVLLVALSLSLDENIKTALLKNKPVDLKLQKFADLLYGYSSMKHIWIQVLTNHGVSLYRSWTDKRGDSLLSARIDVAKMIQKPQIISSISTGKYDMTFKSMVPIYKNKKFIGSVEALARFNSIIDKMKDRGAHALVVVDKSYKTQLTKAITKQFMHEYYIVNDIPNEKLLRLFKESSYEKLLIPNKYKIDKKDSLLICTYILNDIYGNKMGYFILSKDLNQISMVSVNESLKQLSITLLVIAFFIMGYIYYAYVIRHNKMIQKQNEYLEERVQSKTKELYHTAHHDSLTNLPNRVLFLDRLQQAIKHASRHNKNIFVLFLDLDDFKSVNDRYGHQVGDILLIEVADRLQDCVRDEDTVARIGGDEFIIIVQDITRQNVHKIVQKIIDSMQEPFNLDEIEVSVTFSIGISSYPKGGETKDELLKNADIAMYNAKDLGKNTYQFFN